MNSFVFTGGSVAVKLVLGMVMALVLTTPIRWRGFWTGVLLIPWVAPTVVSALNFLWIFDYSLGRAELPAGAGVPRSCPRAWAGSASPAPRWPR